MDRPLRSLTYDEYTVVCICPMGVVLANPQARISLNLPRVFEWYWQIFLRLNQNSHKEPEVDGTTQLTTCQTTVLGCTSSSSVVGFERSVVMSCIVQTQNEMLAKASWAYFYKSKLYISLLSKIRFTILDWLFNVNTSINGLLPSFLCYVATDSDIILRPSTCGLHNAPHSACSGDLTSS